MDSWFTLEKIDNDTYAISEYGHPEKMHSYLLIDENSACLIDTGMGIGNIKEVVRKLTLLPVYVITTHAHWDHIGGHKHFQDIYIHEAEAGWLRNGMPITLEQIRGFVLEGPITKSLPVGFDINEYYPYKGEPTQELKHMDIIRLDKRVLRIIHTPGHSPGHICIFEESSGYLFTGDLIYKGMLYAHLPESVPELYHESVKGISMLQGIKKVLTAHNDTVIEQEYILEVANAFEQLNNEGKLQKGSGVFTIGNCTISL